MRERACFFRAPGNGAAPRGAMSPARLLISLLPAIFLVISGESAGARVTLSADAVQASFLDFRGVQVSLSGSPAPVVEITLDEIAIEGRRWRNLHFSCPVFQVSGGMVRCDDGVLRIAKSEPLHVAFRFSAPDNTLQAAIRDMPGHAEGGGWKLSIHGGVSGWEGTVTVENGKAAQVAPFLPVWESEIDPSSVKGKINGVVQLSGQSDGLAHADVKLALNEVTFSDATGLHAGENISIDLNAKVTRGDQREGGNVWQWNVDASWPKGEVFWQPLYFAGRGHRFHAGGDLDEDTVRLRKGRLTLADIGEMDFSGTVDSSTKALREFSLTADNLQLAGLFEQVLQPFLVNTSFAGLKTIGRAGIQWRYRDRAHQLLDVYLQDVSVKDGQERFAFEGMNARIPWQASDGAAAKEGEVMIADGRIGRIPIGPVHFPLEITGLDEPGVRIARMTVPILDGQLMLEQFSAQRQARRQEEAQEGVLAASPGWEWEFSGRLMPISMQKLTEALETQTMQGTFSGEIPKVSYKDSTVNVEGALVLRVFDGSVVVWNLKALDPFGHASSLMADVDMRNLDLNLLTGTFSFGKILGRIDVAVHNLELFGWKPVKFDASLKSSPGEYPRRISQDAVQNISSLGGSGAVAAIQRSVLRFFDEFGYSQIGWSCALRNGICRMGGIASEPLPHGYLIVKGGGIPAITVIGYNRDVDWPELVSRLQRITGDHAQPVIQ